MAQGGGADQPWSPFPVQDWSTMPADPMRPPVADEGLGTEAPAWGVSSTDVLASWAPPRDPRPAWLPLLVIGLLCALVAGALATADRVGSIRTARGSVRFVPADGAVAYAEQKLTRELDTRTTTTVTESARLAGLAGTSSLEFAFSTKILGAVDDITQTNFWRTTTTQIASVTASQQVTRVYRVNGPVELLGESAPNGTYVYQPALSELPQDVAPGASWTSAGSASDTLDYRSDFRADAGPDGCLVVSGTVAYDSKTGQPGVTRSLSKTWCAGAGITAASESGGNTALTERRVARPPAEPDLRTTDEPTATSAPATWTRKRFGTKSIDPQLGDGPMLGTATQVPPVVAASGLVIRNVLQGGDLVALTPKTQQDWTVVWRMHPGGTVLSLAAFGNVIVATTSQRQLVAYSDAGVRLWETELDEVSFRPPVRLADTELAFVDPSGTLRVLAIATGAMRWQRTVGSDVAISPVVGAGVVVICDHDRHVTAYDAMSGDQRWQVDAEATRAVVVGDAVMVFAERTLEALDVTTGRRRWMVPVAGTATALVGVANDVVIATKTGTLIIDPAGRIVGRLPAVGSLTPVGSHLIGWGNEEAIVLDPGYAVVARFDLAAATLGSGPKMPLPYRQGVWLFTTSWDFEAWSDEPP